MDRLAAVHCRYRTAGPVKEALFRINAELHPESWNAYDSLAEGYMEAGEKDEAIKYYRRSLELNPKNTNAVEILKKLGAE